MKNITYTPFISEPVALDISIPVSENLVPEKPPISELTLQSTPQGGQKQKTSQSKKPVAKTPTTVKFSGDKSEFKSTMLPLYEKLLKENNINPEFAEYLVAQDALESGWGKHISGKNNLGGIKGKGTTLRTREVINGQDVYINDSFKDFASLEDYARYKINLLNNKRYQAFSGTTSEFASRVAGGGYATDPRYKDVLNNMMNSVRKAKSGMQVPELREDTRSKIRRWWDNLKSDYQNSAWKKSAPAAVINTFTPASIIDQALSNDVESGAKEAAINILMTSMPVTNTARKIIANEKLLDDAYAGVKKVYDHYGDRLDDLFLDAQTYLKNKYHQSNFEERLKVPKPIERQNMSLNPDINHMGKFWSDKTGKTIYQVNPNTPNAFLTGEKHAAEQTIARLLRSPNPKAVRPVPHNTRLLFGHGNEMNNIGVYAQIMAEKANLGIKNSFQNLTDKEAESIFKSMWNRKLFRVKPGETIHEFWKENKYALTNLFKTVPVVAGAAAVTEIPEHKNGGILKFADGGVSEDAQEFINNWYDNRDQQLINNYKATSPIPLTASYLKRWLAKNMRTAEFKIGPTSRETVDGMYHRPSHTITVKTPNTEHAIHEYTHAANNDPSHFAIYNIKNELGNKIYENGALPDEYLDRDSEILSRLMELRYKYNIDPNKHWTPADIEELKSKVTKGFTTYSVQKDGDEVSYNIFKMDNQGNATKADPYTGEIIEKQTIRHYDPSEPDILNRYNSHFLSRIFNEVADNREDKSVNYVQEGGIIGSGVLLNDANLQEKYYNPYIPEVLTYEPAESTNRFREAMKKVGNKYSSNYDDELYMTIADSLNTSNQVFDPYAVANLIGTESSFKRTAKNPTSSAVGPFQYTKDTLKSIRPDDWQEVYNQYVLGTRSNELMAQDAKLLLERISNNIKKDGNYGYGRLKINWLAPNASLDQTISKAVYNNLTSEQKKQVPINSTYRFLMHKYDEWINEI